MLSAALLVDLARLWLWAGAAVALPFLLWGVGRVEPNARGAWAFRPLLVPGLILLWPLVLWRWVVLEADRDRWSKRHLPPRRAHGVAALLLAVLVLAAILAGIAIRQAPPSGAPVLLAAPE